CGGLEVRVNGFRQILPLGLHPSLYRWHMWYNLQAPSLYDKRKPIDQELSDIPLRKNNFLVPTDYLNQLE
ncbi:hypothetical protein L9F63_028039, partial [Diploptera punctata]